LEEPRTSQNLKKMKLLLSKVDMDKAVTQLVEEVAMDKDKVDTVVEEDMANNPEEATVKVDMEIEMELVKEEVKSKMTLKQSSLEIYLSTWVKEMLKIFSSMQSSSQTELEWLKIKKVNLRVLPLLNSNLKEMQVMLVKWMECLLEIKEDSLE